MLNDLQELDETGVATFSDLRFPQGTKKKPVRLQFAVEVQFVQPDGSIASAVLESNQTSPFVGSYSFFPFLSSFFPPFPPFLSS